MDVVGLCQLKQLSLLLVDVLSLEPLSHCLSCSLSTISNRLIFVLCIEEEDCRETLDLILAHELLVLASVNAGDVHSFSNHFREFAVLGLKILAMAALNKR